MKPDTINIRLVATVDPQRIQAVERPQPSSAVLRRRAEQVKPGEDAQVPHGVQVARVGAHLISLLRAVGVHVPQTRNIVRTAGQEIPTVVGELGLEDCIGVGAQ